MELNFCDMGCTGACVMLHTSLKWEASPSGPGLKKPTLPPTADRISAARLIPPQSAFGSGEDLLLHKGGAGFGAEPHERRRRSAFAFAG
jgi:hypothetical protein